MEEFVRKNPWLGLASYKEGEILYGRDDDIRDLSQCVLNDTETLLYGKSGIGKSSILNAGILPAARRNGYLPVLIRLSHMDKHSYLFQINQAIFNAILYSQTGESRTDDTTINRDYVSNDVKLLIREVVPCKNEETESFYEYFHRHTFYNANGNRLKLLIIFDQFEEIFTLQGNLQKKNTFFAHLADLLNDIMPDELQLMVEVSSPPQQNIIVKEESDFDNIFDNLNLVVENNLPEYVTDNDIHFIFTIREEFLSEFEYYTATIPSLKQNRYGLRPINEEQAAQIILRPVPNLIDEAVAKLILEKISGKKDFKLDGVPEMEVDSAVLSLYLNRLYDAKEGDIITIDLVEQKGGEIIPDFYNEALSGISDSKIEYLEYMLLNGQGRRDSITVYDAINEGNISERELDLLCNQKRILRFFYNNNNDLCIEYVHDILCPIVFERRKRREEEFERKKQEEALIKLRKEKRRYRLTLLPLFIVFSLIPLGVIVYDGWYDVKVERYAKIIKENTWMKGVRPLSEEDASYLNHHYVFYKTGRYAEYADSIEARNGYGDLTSNHSMGDYLEYQFDDTDNKADQQIVNKLNSVVKWVMIPDKSGKSEHCLQEKAYDKDGTLVFSYNNTMMDNDSMFISTYVDEYGFPIAMRDSCYIFLRTTLNQDGHQVLQEFFDDKGFPVMNKNHSFQTERSYFPNGIQKSEASRFLNGHRMIDRLDNCGWEVLEVDENGYETLSVYFDADREPCRLNDGVMFKRYEYDKHGRQVKETYWKLEDTSIDVDWIKPMLELDLLELLPDTNKNGVHGEIYEYNRHGKMTLFYAIDLDGNPKRRADRNFVELRRQYDDKGNMISEISVDESGINNWVLSAEYAEDGEIVFDKRFNINEEGDMLMGRHIYWDNNLNRKIDKDYYHYAGYYKYREYDAEGRVLVSARYEIDTDKPVGDIDGLHKTITEYQYDKDKKRLTQTERYFDVNGYVCGYRGAGSFSKEILVIDSVAHTKFTIRYTTKDVFSEGVDLNTNPDEIFYNGSEQFFNDKFTISLGESSIGAYGMKHRTYKQNNAYYYQARFIYSILPSHANESKGHYALNEFGEPSLIRINGDVYSALYDGKKFDEYGHEIDEGGLDDQPLFAAIETDVDMGFMDGDILIQQDDWLLWKSGNFSDLELEPQPDMDHHFKVLRFNESQKEYDIIEIDIPAGDERVTSIKYMKFYMTKAEENRVFDVMREKVYDHMFEFVPSEEGAIYERGMKRQAMVLAINDWDMTRHFGGERDSIIELLKRKKDEVKHIMVYDEELEEVQTYVVDADTLGVKIVSYSVRPGYYNQLLQEMKNKQLELKE